MKIDRNEFISKAAKSINDFVMMEFLKETPDNVMQEALEILCNGFISALAKVNGKKPAGEIKTALQNYLRTEYLINIDSGRNEQTADWEKIANVIYMYYYPARFDKEVLLEGCSRVIRKLALSTPLPDGVKKIHYRPDDEIIRRFYTIHSKIEVEQEGAPLRDELGYLIDLDGNQYQPLCPIHINDYINKSVAHHNDWSQK